MYLSPALTVVTYCLNASCYWFSCLIWLQTAGSNNLFLGIEQGPGSSNGQAAFSKFDNGSSMGLPSGQAMSGLMGKGYWTTASSLIKDTYVTNQIHYMSYNVINFLSYWWWMLGFKGQQWSDTKKSCLMFVIA